MNTPRKANVLIADARSHVRSALTLRLALEPDIGAVVAVADADHLLATLATSTPDVLLLDWELPGMPQPDLIRRLRQLWPARPIVVMSGRPETRQAALDAGATEFLSKTAPPPVVLTTLRRIIGGRIISPSDPTEVRSGTAPAADAAGSQFRR